MKKIILLTIGLWLITILIVIGILFKTDTDKKMYKININRIHSRLKGDLAANKEIINNLSREELGMISRLKIINYRNQNRSKKEDFFEIGDLYNSPAVYRPIKGSNYLVKYTIETASNGRLGLIICSVITVLFLLFWGGLIYIYKYIIEPMKKVSMIPKQLAKGYIDKLEISDKHQYFNEFIWGLDMLREQLQEEKDRNYELEKERKTLVAGLSHDIKTPLSSIKNYAIALKEGVYEQKTEQNKALDIILDKTERIEKLTKELLESASKEISADALKVKPQEIYMSDIDQLLNQSIQQKIDLLHMKYKAPELKEDLLVIADLDALAQVFDNIVENAIKYGDLSRLEVSYYREDYYQIIAIENTGQPIPKTEIKHIFTSYYRGSNVKEEAGHGLGLYICKEIMQSLEGDIYAENTKAGVKFIIVIRLVS